MDLLKDLREDSAMYLAEMEDIRKLYAKDAMIRPVLLNSDDESNKILKKLKKERINVCLVVDKNKKFIGDISDNDLIRIFLRQVRYEPLVKVLDIGYKREISYKRAKDLVNKNHKNTVKKDTPINEVIKIMYKEDCTYIPVVNDKQEVIGVVTPSSIIDLLRKI